MAIYVGEKGFLDYLINFYDDGLNNPPLNSSGSLDPLEAAAFLKNENIGVQYDPEKDIYLPTDKGIETWIKIAAKRKGDQLVDITPAIFKKYINTDALICSKEGCPEKIVTKKRVGVTQAFGSREAQPVGADQEKEVWNGFGTLYVGNEKASASEHDPDIVRFARPNLPTEYQYFVPAKSGAIMSFKLKFRGVHYYVGAPEKLQRPTHVWIVPRDFRGNLADDKNNISAADLEAWMKQLATDPNPSVKDIPKSITECLTYFRRIDTTQKGESEFEVAMPAAEYQLRVVSGTVLEAADVFDNIAVDISGKQIKLDPVFGVALSSTIVLGDALNRVSEKRSDGSRTAKKFMKQNETIGAGIYLYPEAYVQYHPQVRDANVVPYSDTRTFSVEKGKKYVLRVEIMGIDEGGSIVIDNSGRRLNPIRFYSKPLTKTELEEQYGEKVKMWNKLLADGVFPPKFKTFYVFWDNGKRVNAEHFKLYDGKEGGRLIGIEGWNGSAENGDSRIWIEQYGDNYFVSYSCFDKEDKIYRLKKRIKMDKYLDAELFLMSYLEADTIILDIVHELPKNIAYTNNKVEIPFTASGNEVAVEFNSNHSTNPFEHGRIRKGDKNAKQRFWDLNPDSIDELRFDNIRLVDEAGHVIRAYK